MYHSQSAPLQLASLHSLAAARLIDRALRDGIPRRCDFAFVHILSKQWLVGIAAAHAESSQARTVRALMRIRLRTSDPVSAVASVVRTRQPLIRSDIHVEPPRPSQRAGGNRISELHRRLAPRSALVVPIILGDRLLGAVSLCYSQSGRRYTLADLPPARRLAQHVGHVLLMTTRTPGSPRLQAVAGYARTGTTLRRRVAARS